MRLINLENLTFIGPGSEWFWTAISGLTVAATLLVIYRQLREQRSSALYEQSDSWSKAWTDDDFAIVRIQFLTELFDRPVEAGLPRSFTRIGDYFERLAYLVRKRHLRETDIYEDMRLFVGFWWAVAEPYIRRQREIEGFPFFGDWEKLELAMRRLDLKHAGKEASFDTSPEARRALVETMIASVRFRAAARNGVFPELSPPSDESPRTG